MRAIFAAHAKVHAGLKLDIPVLSMHSDEADIVLDWKQIARWSRTLGPNVTVLQFPGGLHDLVLSRARNPRRGVQPAFRLGGTSRSVSQASRPPRPRRAW